MDERNKIRIDEIKSKTKEIYKEAEKHKERYPLTDQPGLTKYLELNYEAGYLEGALAALEIFTEKLEEEG